MKKLFAFGCFAHYPQRILAAVHGFALVDIELGLNVIALELSATPFADTKADFHDPQFALRHVQSLAHSAGRKIALLISNSTTTRLPVS
jgi:hypothetical protein